MTPPPTAMSESSSAWFTTSTWAASARRRARRRKQEPSLTKAQGAARQLSCWALSRFQTASSPGERRSSPRSPVSVWGSQRRRRTSSFASSSESVDAWARLDQELAALVERIADGARHPDLLGTLFELLDDPARRLGEQAVDLVVLDGTRSGGAGGDRRAVLLGRPHRAVQEAGRFFYRPARAGFDHLAQQVGERPVDGRG